MDSTRKKTKEKIKGENELKTGQVINRWKIKKYAGVINNHHCWEVQCTCGKWGVVRFSALKTNRSKSCGCLAKDVNKGRMTVHGECPGGKPTPEYRAYLLAKNQCENVNHENFHRFGAVGIKFLFTDFAEFLQEVGRKPGRGHILSRKDKNGNFESGNVEWTRNKNHRSKV